MELKQLSYFVAIVENNFNVSITSKKIHVSQPALSKTILSFEEKENAKLFIRNNGRLQCLTEAGEIFYNNAKQLLAFYDDMLNDLRVSSKKFKGKIRIGIPPLILGVIFHDAITSLILDNPDIEFIIVESGAQDLRKLFLLQEIDLAILLDPTNINQNLVQESIIFTDELTAFMSHNHPLAKSNKLEWRDLHNQKLAIFNNSFMIHHLLLNKIKQDKITPVISLQSGSWDFLLQSTKNSELITILPSPIRGVASMKKLVEIKFNDPIFWKVTLCKPLKERYTRIEEYVYTQLLDTFKSRESGYLA